MSTVTVDGEKIPGGPVVAKGVWKSDVMASRRKSRYAADRRLQAYGIIAIVFALGFLAFLIGTLVFTGYRAFVQTMASRSRSIWSTRKVIAQN